MSRYKGKPKADNGNKPKQNNNKSAVKENDIKNTEESEVIDTESSEDEDIGETEVSEAVDVEDVELEESEEEEESYSEDDEEEEEEKPKEKKPKVKKDAEVSKENEEFLKLSFTERCKKDPVIPVMLLLAFVMVVVASIYFILPNARVHSLGITLEEFETRFDNGDLAVGLLGQGLDIRINYTNSVDRSVTPSILGDQESFTVDSNYVDYFNGDASLLLDEGIEGAIKKTNGELAYIRVYVQYEFEPVWMIYANTLQAIYPDLSKFDAMDIALHEMNEFKGDGLYTVRGDKAFRLIPVKSAGSDEVTYIVVEVVPKASISASQIGKTLEVTSSTTAASDASATVSESVDASTEATAAAT